MRFRQWPLTRCPMPRRSFRSCCGAEDSRNPTHRGQSGKRSADEKNRWEARSKRAVDWEGDAPDLFAEEGNFLLSEADDPDQRRVGDLMSRSAAKRGFTVEDLCWSWIPM